MADHMREAGVIQALLEQLEHQTLPRALDIKRRVDAGETLLNSESAFLEDALDLLKREGPYVEHHPQWEPLYSRLIDLYDQIARQALENERRT